MNIGEFFIKLGVKPDLAALKTFQSEVNKIPGQLLSLKNAFTGLVLYGLDRFVESTIDGTVALQNFNNQTGLSIAQLQKWQMAGQLSDISLSADQVAGSISSLQKNLTNIKLGGGNIRPFQLLGIDVQGKDAFQVLEQLRTAIKGMDNATAVNLIEQTGLSGNFINVLRTTRKEFDKLSQAKFLSKGQRDKLLKLGTAVTKFKLDFKLAKDAIVADLTPVWEALLQIIVKLTRGFERLTGWIIQNKSAMLVLAGVATAIFIALQPLAAGIALLILLIEDFITYLEGGESWIGNWIDKIAEFSTAIYEGMIEPLKDLMNVGTDVMEFLSGGFDLDKISGDLKNFFGFGDQAKESIKPAGGNTSNSSNNTTSFNNSFNIQSTGQPEDVAKSVIDLQQAQLNYAYQSTNNGAKI